MNEDKPLVEVAIAGEGLSPADVPIGQVVELLQATVAAVESIAKDEGLEPPELRLVSVHRGSAGYGLASSSPGAEMVVRRFHAVAKERGAKSGPGVRRALNRLHDAGRQLGSVRIAPKVTRAPKPILVAPPVQKASIMVERSTELHGRVLGLSVKNSDTFVRIKVEDSRLEEFIVDDAVVEAKATSLFKKHVVVQATYEVLGEEIIRAHLDGIDAWGNENLLEVLRNARAEFASGDEPVDVKAWLAELDA